MFMFSLNDNMYPNKIQSTDSLLNKKYSSSHVNNFGYDSADVFILIKLSEQKLYLVQNGTIQASYPISSSKYGIGSEAGSFKTPLGVHRISKKIGEKAERGTIFKNGLDTGRIAQIFKDSTDVPEDYITSRILWLEGLEKGKNKGRGIDSYQRRIYIHGTAEEGLVGQTASHGCIRMINSQIIELFDRVLLGTLVDIQE